MRRFLICICVAALLAAPSLSDACRPPGTDVFTEIFTAGDNDLEGLCLTFTPNTGIDDGYDLCEQSASDLPTSDTGKTTLTLGDNAYATINLSDGKTVELFEETYSTVYVSSNGFLSFNSGNVASIETFSGHFAIPRVAALWDDLDPSSSGEVWWKQLDNRLAVTFEDVPSDGESVGNTFQIEMFFDGKIRITYDDITSTDGLAGISDGAGWADYYAESDLSYDYPDCSAVAPGFDGDPFSETAATEDSAYGASIADNVYDLNLDDLSFSKLSGPAWLSVDPIGALTGTPTNDDVGASTWSVQVADGVTGTDVATLQITVTNTNDAPTFTDDPIVTSQAYASANYSYQAQSIAPYGSDVDVGDTLTYSKVDGPSWLTVASNGALSGTPAGGDAGSTGSCTVQVSDSVATDQATLSIYVRSNNAPVFQSDPYTLDDEPENIAYSGETLSGLATDADGDAITYSKYSGPTWLTVSASGALSGTPGDSDVGANQWTVRATDIAGATDDATLNITVVNCPPTTPTGVIARGTIGSIQVDWDANTESDIDTYHVYRSTTEGGAYTCLTTGSPLSVTTYTDTSVSAGNYWYKITAIDRLTNESVKSDAAGATCFSTCDQRWPAGWFD